jgi:hypothetical protein
VDALNADLLVVLLVVITAAIVKMEILILTVAIFEKKMAEVVKKQKEGVVTTLRGYLRFASVWVSFR